MIHSFVSVKIHVAHHIKLCGNCKCLVMLEYTICSKILQQMQVKDTGL